MFLSTKTALKDNPVYVKALTRRAASNEVLDTWSSLTSAQEGKSYYERHVFTNLCSDYEKLLTLSPPSDVGKIRAALNKVKPRAEAAQKREMSEMMGKLKGIGNSILGTHLLGINIVPPDSPFAQATSASRPTTSSSNLMVKEDTLSTLVSDFRPVHRKSELHICVVSLQRKKVHLRMRIGRDTS